MKNMSLEGLQLEWIRGFILEPSFNRRRGAGPYTMTNATLHFPRAEEYDARIAKTRAAMAERGLDLIIVSDPSNMGWLTGYDGWSFYVHQAVLLGLEGEPVWWGRGMDANGAYRTAFMAT
jgi:ectoine hydrolase